MMRYEYIKKIQNVLAVIKVETLYSYYWGSENIFLLPRALRKILPGDVAKAHLINSLNQKLYTNFYCKGFTINSKIHSTNQNLPTSEAIYLKQLSASNKSNGYLDGGWSVLDASDKLTVTKNGLRLILNKNEYFSPESTIVTGAEVFQRMPKEHRFLSPGFFTVFSNVDFQRNDNLSITRFYWNLVDSKGALVLTNAVTTILNNAGFSFRFKVLDQPGSFNRCDAAVLYIFKINYEAAKNAIEEIYATVFQHLKFDTPVFTKHLAPGLGLAESPDNGVSFGMHRCNVIADGIVRAFNQGEDSIDKRLEIVQHCFEEKNISLETPFLNPGSIDAYNFRAGNFSIKQNANKPGANFHELLNHDFLQTAAGIGELLSSKAIWYNNRCNWMGLRPKNKEFPDEETSNLVYEALGADVYSGTSGIAMFLAELYKATGNSSTRSLALAAIQQAIAATYKIPVPGLGFYDGLIGIAFAAAYIGKLLGEEHLLQSASRILNTVLEQNREKEFLDQVSGNAGAINALLALKDILDNESLLAFAMKLGDELIQKAICRQNYCSWKSPGFLKQQNLLGFSHGTAGIGYALIDLFKATGELHYKQFAESAFNYEQYWYDKEKNNWPDFRGVPASARKKNDLLNFPVSWCHGAPGVALSRLLSYKILQNNKYKSEALTALKTTGEWTEKMVDMHQTNFCLCHGLSGNADILYTGFEILGEEFSIGRYLAFEVATAGISLYARQNDLWPFDVLGKSSPGMMPGLSGVGFFYLRLYNQQLPSLLALDREKILQRLSS